MTTPVPMQAPTAEEVEALIARLRACEIEEPTGVKTRRWSGNALVPEVELQNVENYLRRLWRAMYDAAPQHPPAPLSVPSDAELCEYLRGSFDLPNLREAAARIEALNALVARLDSAWTAMNELQAKEWRRAEKAEAELSRLRPLLRRWRENANRGAETRDGANLTQLRWDTDAALRDPAQERPGEERK